MRWLVALVFLGACNSPCQRVCVRMAEYADECGFAVSDAELDACLDDEFSSDAESTCRQTGDPQILRDQLSCEDLRVFFGS